MHLRGQACWRLKAMTASAHTHRGSTAKSLLLSIYGKPTALHGMHDLMPLEPQLGAHTLPTCSDYPAAINYMSLLCFSFTGDTFIKHL